MRKYYLYALIDPDIKIPKYIGISNSPERRFSEHLEDISNTPKTRWISKLKEGGEIPLLKVLKETEDVLQVCKWEKQAIEKYQEKWGLTNATRGGEYYAVGTPIDVYDLDCNYISSYNSMVEFCELHGLSKNYSSISATCLRKRNYTYGYIFRYSGDPITEEDKIRLNNSLNRPKTRHLYILDLEGNILGEFENAREAERKGFGRENQILSCLNHPEKHCSVKGNLVCEYLEDYPMLIENYLSHVNDHGGWITQYTLEGIYVNRFPTISAAVKSLGKTGFSSIKECLSRNNSTYKAYNYLWRYSYSKDNIEPYKKYNPGEKSKQNAKKIHQFSLDGKFIQEFESSRQVEEILGFNAQGIRSCANGSSKTSNGYIWKYV